MIVSLDMPKMNFSGGVERHCEKMNSHLQKTLQGLNQ